MKKVYLGGKHGSIIGNYALVDDNMFDEVNKYKWCVHKRPNGNLYAKNSSIKINGKRKYITMHRFIWEFKNGIIPLSMEIDHIENKDEKSGLNNLFKNLRLVTRQQNQFNRKSNRNSSSKYKGVCWNKNSQNWTAQIYIFKKKNIFGLF